MDVKKIALLIGALLVAAVTAVMAKNMFTGASAPEAHAAPVPQGPKILVAKKAMAVGTIVDAESFTFQPWPAELVQNAYYQEGQPDSTMAKLIGTVVRNPITAGQPLTRGNLVGPQDRGFLAAALAPGMRAVTLPLDGRTGGVAGFVFPGDRVDLVLTQTVAGGGDGPPLKVSETIMRNLRILAIDQKVSANGDDGKPQIMKPDTVTVEATPRLAEKIAVAQSLGTISLSLRSIADNTADFQRAIAEGQVKLPANATPADERKLMLSFASQPIDAGSTYTTGGDVSRFQRRTVPAKTSTEDQKFDRAIGALDRMSGAINRAGGGAPAGGETAAPAGPVVRIARGNDVSIVPVGAR
ncbi:Flp pilus assembly protein CpaB [Sphingomonas sp. BN140010]|uniref:Flp pilus assembly protein CpaB n=1 Tax=Sphingomonas arvum TaxID=2992113 RepID=A0ABT3JEG4_9SPHN|nr:Flp pilus assembly protein CpaB [Sphingomonas sp. BN140010]MCW3797155.1 Flp pilus assembly protein CpaB [Sphingomonas sp. BN140010]